MKPALFSLWSIPSWYALVRVGVHLTPLLPIFAFFPVRCRGAAQVLRPFTDRRPRLRPAGIPSCLPRRKGGQRLEKCPQEFFVAVRCFTHGLPPQRRAFRHSVTMVLTRFFSAPSVFSGTRTWCRQ